MDDMNMAELFREEIVQNTYYKVLEMISESEDLEDLAKKIKSLLEQK